MPSSVFTSDDVRKVNLARVLSSLHFDGQLTRSDLATSTGLNRSTIAALINDLKAAGLVDEVRGQSGSVGRPSFAVEVLPASAVVLACEVLVTQTQAALVGLGGKILGRFESAPRPEPLDPATAARQLAQAARVLVESVPEETTWVGVGVSIPGVIDPGGEVVHSAPNLRWESVDFARELRGALESELHGSPPILIGNDANLGALAESLRGKYRDIRSLMFLTADIGVGGGYIEGRRLHTGASGHGGEVGHMIVNPAGKACRCGGTGCWETEVNRAAVCSALGLDPMFSDWVAISDRMTRDPEDSREVLSSVARWTGIGLSNLVNTFDPEVIILGGHLGLILDPLRSEISAHVRRTWDPSRSEPRLAQSSFGREASLMGASELAFMSLLDDPLGALDHSQWLVTA